LRHSTAGYSFWSHVGLATNIGFRYASNEVARHTKIADLHLALGIDEDIRRFHIPVDDIVIVLKGPQALSGRIGDFP
jgi:hypothetical protein